MGLDEVLDDGPAKGIGKGAPHDDVVVGVGLELDEHLAPREAAVVGARNLLLDAHLRAVDLVDGLLGRTGGGVVEVGAVVRAMVVGLAIGVAVVVVVSARR